MIPFILCLDLSFASCYNDCRFDELQLKYSGRVLYFHYTPFYLYSTNFEFEVKLVLSRRSFFKFLGWGNFLAATGLAFGPGLIRFLYPASPF